MGEQGRSSVKHIKAGPAQFCVCLCVCVCMLDSTMAAVINRHGMKEKGVEKKKRARSRIEAVVV